MNQVDNEPPDGEMTPEQAKVVAALSQEQIERIDACLLSQVRNQSQKVSMIIGFAMMDESLCTPRLPDLFYRDRLKRLVSRGLLVAHGDLDHMRFCEVRLPE